MAEPMYWKIRMIDHFILQDTTKTQKFRDVLDVLEVHEKMLSGVFKEELRICPNVANTLRVYHQKISDLLYFHLLAK